MSELNEKLIKILQKMREGDKIIIEKYDGSFNIEFEDDHSFSNWYIVEENLTKRSIINLFKYRSIM